MESSPEQLKNVRELNYRRTDQMDIFLFWHTDTNILSIYINDQKENKEYKFEVPNDQGMKAFKQPFAFCPDDCF